MPYFGCREAAEELARRQALREAHEAEVKAAQADLAHTRARLRDIAATAEMFSDTKTEMRALAALHAPLLVPPKNRDVYMGNLE